MRSPITFSRRLLSIETLHSLREFVLLDPHYQRQGDVWSHSKQQLFLDSVLNGFIIPPLYWHSLSPSSEYFRSQNRYAVVDGRQRLETLYRFLDDDIVLARDFSLFESPEDIAGPLSISELRTKAPWLYAQLMRTEFEVVVIETVELGLIEELFSRLNEGVPLSAAEHRNRGAVLAPAVANYVHETEFFTSKLPFGNVRYRHYDLLAKFMRIEDRGMENGRVPDLRKRDLDRLFDRITELEKLDRGHHEAQERTNDLLRSVSDTLDVLNPAFVNKDPFLGSVGMVTLYYAADKYLREGQNAPLRRDEIEHFESTRLAVKYIEDDYLDANERRVVEFGRYSQGPTSGTYLTARLQILLAVLRGMDLSRGTMDNEDI